MAQQDIPVLYRWTALEFSRAEKRPVWYLAAVAVAMILTVYAVYSRDWLRLAVLVMGAVTLFLVLRSKPQEFEHALTPEGIGVGRRSYKYSDFASFAVIDAPDGTKLRLLPKRRLGPALSLQLGGADVEKIRAILLEYLEEQDGEEDLLDRMNRALGI